LKAEARYDARRKTQHFKYQTGEKLNQAVVAALLARAIQ